MRIAMIFIALFAFFALPSHLDPTFREESHIHSMIPKVVQVTVQPPKVSKPNIQIRDTEVECLAKNIYYEARGESVAGQMAVGEVTINRVRSPRFPSSVCGVISQRRGELCQFSWKCAAHISINDKRRWRQIMKLASYLYDNYLVHKKIPDLVDGAMYFHNNDVLAMEDEHVTATIDHQVYYRLHR